MTADFGDRIATLEQWDHKKRDAFTRRFSHERPSGPGAEKAMTIAESDWTDQSTCVPLDERIGSPAL